MRLFDYYNQSVDRANHNNNNNKSKWGNASSSNNKSKWGEQEVFRIRDEDVGYSGCVWRDFEGILAGRSVNVETPTDLIILINNTSLSRNNVVLNELVV